MSDVDTAAPAVDTEVPSTSPSAPVPGTTDTPETGQKPDPTPPEGATPEDDLSETKVVKKPWYQKKIAELSYQNRELQRDRERLWNLIDRNQRTENRTGDEAPNPDDFPTVQQYLKAAVAFEAKHNQGQKQQGQPEARTPQVNQEFEAAREDLIAEGLEKYEDFEEIVNQGRYITPIMANAVVESENRVEVTKFLCLNHKEAKRIAQLSPVRQVAEIARIEDKLNAKPIPPKKPSSAPAPVNPVGGASTQDNGLSDEIPITDWMKKRSKLRHSK